MASGIGMMIGWVAHTLISEPYGPDHEQRLIDAYSQGWRACETFLARDMAEVKNHLGEKAPDLPI